MAAFKPHPNTPPQEKKERERETVREWIRPEERGTFKKPTNTALLPSNGS
jgi:hypothetical protein